MPYNSNAAGVVLSMPAPRQYFDYHRANPGQWFYGIVNTSTGHVYIAPGDVHDDPRNAAQENPRMLNTYASKAAVPAQGWSSLAGASVHEQRNGLDSTPTGHMALLKLMGVPAGDLDAFLGFRVVKINRVFAQFSDRSNSLNAGKLDQRRTDDVIPGPGGWKPSSTARMPPQWADKVIAYLQDRLGIRNVARDY